jgi:lipopolysaccharide export system protein LptC
MSLGAGVLDPDGRDPWPLPSASRRTPAFDRALRHSRFVRILRIVLPLVCFAALAVVVVLNSSTRTLSLHHVSSSGVVLNGTSITMQAPQLNGYTRDRRAYHLTSQTATHDILNPTKLDMVNVHATLAMADASTTELTARRGHYDSNKDLLLLDGDIVVRNNTGLTARFVRARVEPSRGLMSTDQPVDISMPDATLRADAMELGESGDVLRFSGNVVMHIAAPPPAAAATETVGAGQVR